MKKTILCAFLAAVLLCGAASAQTADAVIGDLEKTVFGAGTIQPVSQPGAYAAITADVSEILVSVGDAVKAGDLLARLENSDLALEAEQLEHDIQVAYKDVYKTKTHEQYKYVQLKDEMGKPRFDFITGEPIMGKFSNEITIYAPCAGRIMAVYIEEGDDSLAVYREHGAVVMLSTDGRMKVELSDVRHGGLALDDLVYITGEGVDTTGTVVGLTRRGTEATIHVYSDSYPMDTPVTVAMPDGTFVGEGILEINKPMAVSSYGGTVKGLPYRIRVGNCVEQNEVIARIEWNEIPLYRDNDVVQHDYALIVAQLEAAREKLTSLGVVAPCDGTIATVDVSEGDSVEDGTKLLSLVEADAGMSLILSVDELDIIRVQPGQTVSVSADALPDVTLTGVVEKIAPLGNTETSVTTYDVYVTLTGETDGRIRGGMNVTGEIVVDALEQALTIPTDALKKGDQGWYVTLATGETRSVEPGVMTDSRTQILSGLSEGETVEY